jgi:DNA-binding response OmpR family regulator
MALIPTTIETVTRPSRVRRSVLVVDDDPNIRETLAIHLRNVGYVVRTAKDGIEGGYSVLADRPDLVITDVQMPYMDGFDFLAALRADKSVSDIAVIMLTSEVEWEERGKRLGANGYVTKPVRADRLLSIVAAQLDAQDRRRVA